MTDKRFLIIDKSFGNVSEKFLLIDRKFLLDSKRFGNTSEITSIDEKEETQELQESNSLNDELNEIKSFFVQGE